MSLPVRQDPDAVEILRLHDRIQAQYQTCVDWAIECGGKLHRKRLSMKRGEWSPWVKHHLSDISERTVQVYIQCWENKDELKKGNALSIREGLRLIADKDERNPQRAAAKSKNPNKKAPNECSTECSTEPEDPIKQAEKDCESRHEEEEAGVVTHEPVVDVEGFPIPADLVDFYERRSEIDGLLKQVSNVRVALRRMIKEKDPMAAGIQQFVPTHLDAVYTSLTETRPDVVCLHCNGVKIKSCLHCKGTGFTHQHKAKADSTAKRQERNRRLNTKIRHDT